MVGELSLLVPYRDDDLDEGHPGSRGWVAHTAEYPDLD
jgi:hypothetical protein